MAKKRKETVMLPRNRQTFCWQTSLSPSLSLSLSLFHFTHRTTHKHHTRSPAKMTDPAVPDAEEELVDYEEEEAGVDDKKAVAAGGAAGAGAGGAAAGKGAGYVGIHSSGFKDFLLKPELLRAIVDCGFEHPSEGKQKQKEMDDDDGAAIVVGVLLFFLLFSRPRVLLAPFGARFRFGAESLEVSRTS